MTTDIRSFTDKANPSKAVSRAVETQAQANLEKLTRQMECRGMDHDHASEIAERIAARAEGPVANHDWMALQANRFSENTQKALDEAGLTRELVLTDHNKAEDYVSQVFEKEGIPNGNGGVDKPKDGVASGHYEKRSEGGVGIDLVAADQDGVPMPIEVKKYQQTSSAQLENRSVGGEQRQTLEPEVAAWKAQREQLARAGTGTHPDADATWKPEVAEWRQQVAHDQEKVQASGELPIQQMDDLWTQDRWLKLVKTQDGQQHMCDIGVDAKYLDYDRLRSSPDLPERRDILDRRTTVVVSDSRGDVGKQLFLQAVFEKRSKSVMKIEV